MLSAMYAQQRLKQSQTDSLLRMESYLAKQLDDVRHEIRRHKDARAACPCEVVTMRGRIPCEEGQECPAKQAVGG